MVMGAKTVVTFLTRSLKLYSRLLHTLLYVLQGPRIGEWQKIQRKLAFFLLTYCGRKVHVDTGNDIDMLLAH